MVQYVITPWRNQDELLLVRQQLYPDTGKPLNSRDRKQAVAKVSVWVQRGNCPHLVESTAIITAAILNDVPGNSTYCVRAAYSAAFCRFVTGLLDSHQDKRRKLSMYSIAKTLGLPATYVELRHQATHEELPSLSKLRIASQKALRWIWDYYWVTLSAKEPAEDKYLTFAERIVVEKDPANQQKLEAELKDWEPSKLLDALETHGNTLSDSELLLRNLKIQQMVMSIVLGYNTPLLEKTLELSGKALGNVQAELEEMEEQLAENEDSEMARDELHDRNGDDNIKGWAMWEGPWTPKPIGVV